MYKIIESPAITVGAQAYLESRVMESADKSGPLQLGYQGGGRESQIHYFRNLKFWIAFADARGRYWNALGIGDPFTGSRTIIAEINPPKAGLNRRVSGAFLIDRVGGIYLGHRGKVGGGRKGIGKKAFMAWYRGDKEVVDDSGRYNEIIIIGALDDETLIEKLATFTYSVSAFKEQAVFPR